MSNRIFENKTGLKIIRRVQFNAMLGGSEYPKNPRIFYLVNTDKGVACTFDLSGRIESGKADSWDIDFVKSRAEISAKTNDAVQTFINTIISYAQDKRWKVAA